MYQMIPQNCASGPGPSLVPYLQQRLTLYLVFLWSCGHRMSFVETQRGRLQYNMPAVAVKHARSHQSSLKLWSLKGQVFHWCLDFLFDLAVLPFICLHESRRFVIDVTRRVTWPTPPRVLLLNKSFGAILMRATAAGRVTPVGVLKTGEELHDNGESGKETSSFIFLR